MMTRKLLHEVAPREQSGRDAVARFKAQYRAAAFKCLSLLKDEDVVAIYCDLHDDYVIKRKINDEEYYDFFQVKTNNKKGFQWRVPDIFGYKTRKKQQELKDIKDSFFGKLIIHTIEFGDACNSINIQSNKDFCEEIYEIEEGFKSLSAKNKIHIFLKQEFKNIFSTATNLDTQAIEKNLAKFNLDGASEVADLEGSNYLPLARQEICEISEVDLSIEEVIEVALGILELVQKKSTGVINIWSKTEIDKLSSICLDDLLKIMTISPASYQYLKNGGDKKALKHTSIIQRFFQETGASSELIDYLCMCKSQYDHWNLSNKHFLSELDFNIFKSDVREMVEVWIKNERSYKAFLKMASEYKRNTEKYFISQMDDNIVVGALLSEIVRQRI